MVILEAYVPEGEAIVCPNCHGSGEDGETMICVMCGGDGFLGDEDAVEEAIAKKVLKRFDCWSEMDK